jgi:hypothetical protein
MTTTTTRPLRTTERVHLTRSGKAHDAQYVRLLMALTDTGSAYEAVIEDEAARCYHAIKRQYDAAGKAFADYARKVA